MCGSGESVATPEPLPQRRQGNGQTNGGMGSNAGRSQKALALGNMILGKQTRENNVGRILISLTANGMSPGECFLPGDNGLEYHNADCTLRRC